MEGLVAGIYKILAALNPIALAVLILMLALSGITSMIDGAEGIAKLKQTIKVLVIAAAITFSASLIGKEIASWFM